MSRPIVPCGAFFPKTAEGFLVNPCAPHLVDERFEPLLTLVKNELFERQASNLHSIYLRGSVPRGMADEHSDIDVFALVFSEKVGLEEPEWVSSFEARIADRFSFPVRLDLHLAGLAPVLRAFAKSDQPSGGKSNPQLAMILQTQSLCIYGPDLIPRIPPYRPDENMMLAFRWLEADLAAFAKDETDTKARQQLLKTIIRSGFESVMPKIQQYTPDLYLCYVAFAETHPKRGRMMRDALYAWLNPEETKAEQIDLIGRELGEWLLRRFQGQF